MPAHLESPFQSKYDAAKLSVRKMFLEFGEVTEKVLDLLSCWIVLC